jgi:hypothetical protein
MTYGNRDRRQSSGSSKPEYSGPSHGKERGYSGTDRLGERRSSNSDRNRGRGASEEGEV